MRSPMFNNSQREFLIVKMQPFLNRSNYIMVIAKYTPGRKYPIILQLQVMI